MMFWALEHIETWSKISAQIVYEKLGFYLFYIREDIPEKTSQELRDAVQCHN